MRRWVEGAIAAVGLVVLAPLMGAIALLVRTCSGRPVIFGHSRVGRAGREFTVLKFRTMRPAAGAGEAVSVTVAGDARVTAVGRVLRRTKLDELPQLINIVRGEMAFVGPRPEVRRYADLWPSDLRGEILSVRPGLTDPATLALRREEELLAAHLDPERFYRESILPRKAMMYADYVRTRRLRSDVVILARTVRMVVRG